MLLLSLNVTFVAVALSLFGYLFLFVNSVNLLINYSLTKGGSHETRRNHERPKTPQDSAKMS